MSTLPLGVLSSHSTPMRLRVLAANSGVHFSVRSARVIVWEGTVADPDFYAEARSDPLGWFIEVAYRGIDRTPRRLKAMLVVETDRVDVARLEIPVTGVVPMTSERPP